MWCAWWKSALVPHVLADAKGGEQVVAQTEAAGEDNTKVGQAGLGVRGGHEKVDCQENETF